MSRFKLEQLTEGLEIYIQANGLEDSDRKFVAGFVPQNFTDAQIRAVRNMMDTVYNLGRKEGAEDLRADFHKLMKGNATLIAT